jgi:transposase-like protein
VRHALASQALPSQGSDEDRALRAELVRALGEHRGNVSAVARELGKARVQIRRWCRRFGLDPDTFRGA